MSGYIQTHGRDTITKDANGDKCQRVCISDAQLPLQVEVSGTSNITSINQYAEISAVAVFAESDIISYTVPASKEANISFIDASGDNTATFRVKLNGTTIAKKRSYPGGSANVEFSFDRYLLAAGDVIKVTGENCSLTNDVAEFEARINGVLTDA